MKKVSDSGVAVIIVDMQAYFVASLTSADRNMLIAEQTRLIGACGERGYRLIILELDMYGSTVPDIAEPASKVSGCVFLEKPLNDGFEDTNLYDLLKSAKSESLIVTGVNASFCVLSTAKSGQDFGFRVFTSERLIADDPYHEEKGKSLHEYSSRGILYPHNDLFSENFFAAAKPVKSSGIYFPPRRLSRWRRLFNALKKPP